MKQSKRILSLILVFCLLLTVIPFSAGAVRTGYPEDGDASESQKTYTIYNNDDPATGTVTGTATVPYYDTTPAGFTVQAALGTKFLIMSDIHGMQGAVGDHATGRLYNILAAADPSKEFSAILHGGDYEAGMGYYTQRYVVDAYNSIVDDYYGDTDTIVLHTMGNHERKDSDAVFETYVGWKKNGLSVIGYKDAADQVADIPAYYVYALGWYGNKGTSTSTGSFDLNALSAFDTWMENVDPNIPVFVISHTPLHYLSDSRMANNAASVIPILNQYPNVIFTWGHNHTEADPMYTTVLEAGDVITYDAAGSTEEILFTYAGMGAGRANGHLGEVGYSVSLSDGDVTDGTQVNLQYYRLTDEDENTIEPIAPTPGGIPGTFGYMDPDTEIQIYADSEGTVSLANLFVSAPRALEDADFEAREFSERFDASAIEWYDEAGNKLEDGSAFDFETEYTAAVQLTADDYDFDDSLEIRFNGVAGTVENGDDFSEDYPDSDFTGSDPVAYFVFDETASKMEGDGYLLADSVGAEEDGYTYALVAGGFDALTNTLSNSSVAVEDNEIVTDVDSDAQWIAYSAASGGFYLYSESAGQFLNAVNDKGVNLKLTGAPSTIWDIDDNCNLHTVIDGTTYYAYIKAPNLYGVAAFALSTSSAGSNIKLYTVSDDNSAAIDVISVDVVYPVVGNAPEAAASNSVRYAADTAWDPDDTAFDYDTAYTASIEVTPESEFSFADTLAVLVNGVALSAANYTVEDDCVYIELNFNETPVENEYELGAYSKFIEVDTVEEGYYVIAADDVALTCVEAGEDIGLTDTVLAGSAIELADNGLYLDNVQDVMVWYADGNGVFSPVTDLSMYLAILSSNPTGKPEDAKNELTILNSATTWTLADGILMVPGSTNPPSANKCVTLGDNETFTLKATGSELTFYKLVNYVPVATRLDNEVLDDYYSSDDIYFYYDGDVYQPDDDGYITMPYDEDFYDYDSVVILGLTGYNGNYTSNDVINDMIGYSDEDEDIIYAGAFVPGYYDGELSGSDYGAYINFYSITVYDRGSVEDYQEVLEGYMGTRGTYVRRGYIAELYLSNGLRFRFDEPVYSTKVVEIEWVKIEESDDTDDEKDTSTLKDFLTTYISATGGTTIANPANFTDIANHWARYQIEFVVRRGLFNGVTDTLFAPDAPMTRGMLVTVLYRNSRNPALTARNSFADVPAGAYFDAPVSWAYTKGVVKGYSDTAFGPDDNITREQLAAIIYRYAQVCWLDTSARASYEGFADAASVSDWASEAMQWCIASGIITGKPGALIDPQGNATRAEVAVILQRFIALSGY